MFYFSTYADADILKTYEDSPKNDHDVCVNLLKEKEERKRAHQTTNLTGNLLLFT